MIDRGVVTEDQLKTIYTSQTFPTTGFGVAHNLTPELQDKIKEAFFTFDRAEQHGQVAVVAQAHRAEVDDVSGGEQHRLEVALAVPVAAASVWYMHERLPNLVRHLWSHRVTR